MQTVKAAFAAFVVALLPLGPALAEPPVAQLTANGEGAVGAIPDIAVVTLGVTTRAATARQALDENSARLAATIETLRAAKIADTDIGTSGFQVFPVYEDRPVRDDGSVDPTPARIVGYQVTNEVRVTIRAIGSSGDVLDAVVSAGANQVSGIAFDLSDPATPADAALAEAVADARRKAEIMAKAAGVRLVRILSVQAGGGGPVPYRAEMSMLGKAVPVMPGEQQVTANATVTWEIAAE